MIKRLILTILVTFVVINCSLPYSRVNADNLYEIDKGDGVITFTTRKPSSKQASYRTISFKTPRYSKIYVAPGGGYSWHPKPQDSSFDPIIHEVSKQYDLDPMLIKAVIEVESAYNPYAVSPKGATGLMQLMPYTARRFGVRNAFDVEENLQGGVRYLRWLLDRYNGNQRLALAAYNAGEGAVDPILDVPPYSETINYVKRVTLAHAAYRCRLDGQTKCDISVR
ncbi:MAG: lytic transglycosylase domain-containing protein [Deltaproteobacteria bacterium]|nr:lytic transglycosylase domain-containing protein [Deltaproteobacteria bacterium]